MMLSKTVMIAGAVAWSGVAAGIITGWQELSPAPAPEASRFDGRWEDVSEDPPLLKKTDRLALAEQATTPVKTESLVLMMPQRPVIEEPQERPASKPVEHRRQQSVDDGGGSDLCRRHKMHKVWVSDKSWRCRR